MLLSGSDLSLRDAHLARSSPFATDDTPVSSSFTPILPAHLSLYLSCVFVWVFRRPATRNLRFSSVWTSDFNLLPSRHNRMSQVSMSADVVWPQAAKRAHCSADAWDSFGLSPRAQTWDSVGPKRCLLSSMIALTRADAHFTSASSLSCWTTFNFVAHFKPDRASARPGNLR